jgi:hypothetical protein
MKRLLLVTAMLLAPVAALAAGGKASTFENDILKLIFNATAIGNIADNAGSSPLTNLYVVLHTADPGAGGSCTTSEAAYTSYARVAVARTSGGWTVSAHTVNPATTISFPAATGGSETETWFSICTASSGAAKILYRGPITPNISVSTGVTPQLTTTTGITEN